MAEEKIPTQDMETVETEQKTKSEEPKEITEASKEHKTKKFGFPFHFWKKKKEKDTDKMKQEEKKEEATEMKEETPGAESGTAKQESDLDQNANKTAAESIPMKETKERKDSVSSSSSSSQDEKNKQNDEEEKKSYAEAVSAKQSAPTPEQPKMDIPKPETETKKSSSKKGIFSIFHRKPSKEKEPESVKAPTETTQETTKTVNQPEMADNAIADKTEVSAKETAEENKVIKEEPKPEVKTAGVEGPEDGSESTMKAGEPKAAEETKQAEDTEAKEIPKEVSEKQGGGFFHKFLRAFGCGGDISKENTQPRPQATVA